MNAVWHLVWQHGKIEMHARGGMLGGVELQLGGRTLKPFYEAPWLGSAEAQPDGLLGLMRSEFPCVPFGVPYVPEAVAPEWRAAVATTPDALDASDDLQHGYGCANHWSLVGQTTDSIEIAIDYPASSPIRRLERRITVDPARPALDFLLRIHARRAVSRPLGLHPNFALPPLAGNFRIEPGAFQFGMVHPGGPEPGVSTALAGATFETLARVPLSWGGSGAFDRLPLDQATEEIFQLCGCDGHVLLADSASGAQYRLSWDARRLPSLLLWISNRGRQYSPWNGRNLCVGVEPVASAFELGCTASLAPNPIQARGVATQLELSPDAPMEIVYRIEAEALAG
jgi:hypothetical protein